MKHINSRRCLVYLLAPMLVLLVLASCKKGDPNIVVISDDLTKPEVVTNVTVENFNGGAKITYKLPDSKNLLYVLAQYNINDNRTRETKASYYTDTITVDGFARAQEYEVTLYAVSRANVKSDPVTVKVNPTTPNYQLINSNLDITSDFGGANFYGLNANKVPVSLHILVYNDVIKAYEENEPEYISGDTIDVSVRGLPPTPQKVGVYTMDRFGNRSDTVLKTVTPLAESMLDKSKFFVYKLPSDATIGYGWEFRYFFDGSLEGNGWHTISSPKTIGTFGLGLTAKISRFVVWQRPSDYFGFQNTRKFTMWGATKDNPADVNLPVGSKPGTVAGDWVNMGNFVFPNPQSGLPANQANSADKELVAKGVNFTMPRIAPAVKYLRFEVTQTWGGQDYVNAMEISLYGNPL